MYFIHQGGHEIVAWSSFHIEHPAKALRIQQSPNLAEGEGGACRSRQTTVSSPESAVHVSEYLERKI